MMCETSTWCKSSYYNSHKKVIFSQKVYCLISVVLWGKKKRFKFTKYILRSAFIFMQYGD